MTFSERYETMRRVLSMMWLLGLNNRYVHTYRSEVENYVITYNKLKFGDNNAVH